MLLRDLKTIDDFKLVVDMERQIWGGAYDDVVPVPIFAVTVKRGGILVGAFDDAGTMVGFVYSLPGFKAGEPMQWSHMLGVLPSHRSTGLGHQLKLAQRDRALAQGLRLVEWTFDPLQALNAHLNFRKLGVVGEEYAVNVYGDSTSPLHGRTPTDRLIASWLVSSPHVVRRLDGANSDPTAPENARRGPQLSVRSDEVRDAPVVNRTRRQGEWLVADEGFELPAHADRALVEIPTGFTEMLQEAPDRAHAWRLGVREIFLQAFERGFRAVDFFLDREQGRGRYLLAMTDRATTRVAPTFPQRS